MMRYWTARLESVFLAALMIVPLSASAVPPPGGLTPVALLKAAPKASAYPDADIYWLRREETVTLRADGTVQEDYHNRRATKSRG